MANVSVPSPAHDLEPSVAAAAPARGWHGLTPSVADLIFILLLISLTAGSLAQKMLGDAGIGWHIRTGELILNTRAVPRVDSFSPVMRGSAWYAWEWLYDLLVGGIHRVAGLNGVVFFSALIIAATFAFVFRAMLARGAGLATATGTLLLSIFASSIHFLTRPHLVSWLFAAVFFVVLSRFEQDGGAKQLIWLPAVMLVWVNLHGGFLLGLVLVGIYLVSLYVDGLKTRDAQRRAATQSKVARLAVAGTAAVAVTFVNPYGYHLHQHIYRYLTDSFLMNHIDEFLSPNFHGMPQKAFAVLILLSLLAAAAAPKRLRLSELLVLGFATYSGLYSARNIPTSSILLVLVIAPHLSGAASSSRWPFWWTRFTARLERMRTLDAGLRGHLWPVLVVILGIWVCWHQGRLGSWQVLDAQFSSKRFPVVATDWLLKHQTQEPVFCPDSWGGYLIYRGFPQLQAAVDDRHDLYGSEFLKNYLRVMKVEPGWEQTLEEMRAPTILIPSDSPLDARLQTTPHWQEVYRDSTSVIFENQP